MSPIIPGVIASGISGHLTPPWSPEGAYDALATVTLSTSTASVTFAGIPSEYKHLQIRAIMRSTNASSDRASMAIGFNEDTGTNYISHHLVGDGSSASAASYTGKTSTNNYICGLANIPTSIAPSNVFGVAVIDILDYANTSKNKVVRTLTGQDQNNTSGRLTFNSGLWLSTNAITSISLQNNTEYSGSLVQYSSFALYGVK